MAGEDNLLNKLSALLALFDDASWEALASKGLLRRARKDIEKGLEIAIGEETAETLKIEVPPFLVSMTANGPASATCSCPSPGICQHILAAGILAIAYGAFALAAASKSAAEGGGLMGAIGLFPLVIGGCLSALALSSILYVRSASSTQQLEG